MAAPVSSASEARANRIDFGRINSAALTVLPSLLSRWLPDRRRAGHEWVARNPRGSDRKAKSFSVNITTGKWADFASGDKGGDVVSLTAFLAGTSQADAARSLADMLAVR